MDGTGPFALQGERGRPKVLATDPYTFRPIPIGKINYAFRVAAYCEMIALIFHPKIENRTEI